MPSPGFPTWFATLAPGLQTIYSIASFNQNALHDNISWRQVQQYQKKNYNISWIAIARRDILSMMSVSVNRINNYLIIATLILGVGAGTIWSARFNSKHDDHTVIILFYSNVGISVLYLLLSIMFGVRGQNKAFTHTFRLLTFNIRPENPAEYNHDYMQQIQWIEKQGILALFRIPGLMPLREHHHQEELDSLHAKFGSSDAYLAAKRHMADRDAVGCNIEDFTVLENLDVKTTHTWYLSRYADFMQLWLWYEKYARLAMGLGIISLLQGAAYYFVWRMNHLNRGNLVGRSLPACLLLVLLLSVMAVIMQQNRKLLAKIEVQQAMWMGGMFIAPVMGTIAALADNLKGSATLEDVFEMLCLISHFIFWVFTFVLHENDARINAERRFVLDNFWGQDKPEVKPDNFWGQTNAEVAITVNHEQAREGNISQRNALGQLETESSAVITTEKWPTGSPEFNKSVITGRRRIRRVVRHMLVATILFWVLMIVSVLQAMVSQSDSASSANSDKRLPFAVLHESVDAGAIATLQARAMTCASSRIFLASSSNVFELGNEVLAQVQCSFTTSADIVDITSTCNDHGVCYPVVLQTVDNASHVTDCRTGTTAQLLQAPGPAEYITLHEVDQTGILHRQKLIVAHGSNLLQYRFSQNRSAWELEWPLGPISLDHQRGPLRALASVDASVFLFFSTFDKEKVVERRDLSTMHEAGSWRIPSPSNLTTAGCALDSKIVMTLSSDRTPQLTKLNIA